MSQNQSPMTLDAIIAEVHSKARGRTRYEGQPPRHDEMLVAEIERLRAENAWLREVPWLTAAEPPIGLLISMATCLNHGFGAPDMGDFDYRKPSIVEWQRAMLMDMRKLFDEVVGRGYYRIDREQQYRAALAPETATRA